MRRSSGSEPERRPDRSCQRHLLWLYEHHPETFSPQYEGLDARDKLNTWSRQVQDDEAPDFGANLIF